jgi:hypothetical protein
MRLIVNNKGEYYHIIEELICPFNDMGKDYIILKDGEIIYWKNSNDYYHEMYLDIEATKENISRIELTNYRSEIRKQKTLDFLRENLSKMITYKREIKIDEVLNKTQQEEEYKYWVC